MTALPLTDAQVSGLLQKLITANPDFVPFAQQFTFLGDQRPPEGEAVALARELLALLRESPQQAARIDALSLTMTLGGFDGGVNTTPPLIATAFLLRTHIRCKRRSEADWEFLIEHKPTDSPRLTRLLDKVAALLPGGRIAEPDR